MLKKQTLFDRCANESIGIAGHLIRKDIEENPNWDGLTRKLKASFDLNIVSPHSLTYYTFCSDL